MTFILWVVKDESHYPVTNQATFILLSKYAPQSETIRTSFVLLVNLSTSLCWLTIRFSNQECSILPIKGDNTARRATSFQLYAALRLGSKYAKRIYALCSQWKDKGQTQTFSLDEFKKMLALLDDKGNEQYKQIGQFKQFVLDESVKQINQHTDLQIGYTLQKRGRSFQNITFTVKAQPLAVVLPVKDGPAKVGAAPVGVSDAQYQNARLLLEQWNIKRADVVNQIMNSANLVKEVNKFAYELQTGKVKVEKNVAGWGD